MSNIPPPGPETSSYLEVSEYLTTLVLSDSGPISIEAGVLTPGYLIFLLQKDGADQGNKRCLASSMNQSKLEAYRVSIMEERVKYQKSAIFLKKKGKP